MGYNHFIISGLLSGVLYLLYHKVNDTAILSKVLKWLLIFNFVSFNATLLLSGAFDYKTHLPIHLCYLTELGIFLSIIFKSKILYPWLALNALGGGITGFTNSNLSENALLIEYIHLYASHFSLILFFIIIYLNKFTISRYDFIQSTIFNALLFFAVCYFNILFESNYWFTMYRPPGSNLAQLLPDWPGYLLGLIIIGLISYYITFRLLKNNCNT